MRLCRQLVARQRHCRAPTGSAHAKAPRHSLPPWTPANQSGPMGGAATLHFTQIRVPSLSWYYQNWGLPLRSSGLKSTKPGGVFDSPGQGKSSIAQRIAEIEAKAGEPGFWNDAGAAEKLMGELKALKARYEPWKSLHGEIEDLEVLFGLASDAGDEGEGTGIEASLKDLGARYEKQNLYELMGGEVDRNACFLTIHSGAGGTEACDWSQMLYRMYVRWAERRGFAVEELDRLEAEGGIKSATAGSTGTTPTATSRANPGCTGWCESPPSTPMPGGTPPSLRPTCSPCWTTP